MLIVRWVEDREGCLLANWYDEERAEHGGFAETVVPMDDYLIRRSKCAEVRKQVSDTADWDEDYEDQAPEQPRFALASHR
jgi:hypothetical protein